MSSVEDDGWRGRDGWSLVGGGSGLGEDVGQRRRRRPDRYAALEDPEAFFAALDEEATAHYQTIRDGLLKGVTPNNGTLTWPEFLDRVARANQTAREFVEHELIYLLCQATVIAGALPINVDGLVTAPSAEAKTVGSADGRPSGWWRCQCSRARCPQ